MYSKYLVPYDTNLFESIRLTDNPRVKYLYYKTNADFLLMATGIFHNPRGRRPNSTPHLNVPRRAYIGRGQAYYNLAQSYATETHRRSTAISEILGKLSRGFEKYVVVLSQMRGEYLNLYKRFTGGELYHLENSITALEEKGKLSELHDRFLDAYAAYRKFRTQKQKKLLERLAADIRRVDPNFNFSIE
ncbi:MAG: hypothetical protein JSV33_12135 [bacterium]|nr:MAG: hypothetical protein JSV33_12135 [bacterium]